MFPPEENVLNRGKGVVQMGVVLDTPFVSTPPTYPRLEILLGLERREIKIVEVVGVLINHYLKISL